MTNRRLLLVALGGSAGAGIRWAISTLDTTSAFPWPTLFVNVLGAGLLGWILSTKPGPDRLALLGLGFCGGLTTFSTLSFELATLLRENSVAIGLIYLIASATLGLAAFLGGRAIGNTAPVSVT